MGKHIKGNLNLRQEKFCILYSSNKEFFGNGVESYLAVYNVNRNNPNWYNTAKAAASRLLTNVNLIERIRVILEETGLNDSFIDKQLEFLITQNISMSAKLAAIKEYNRSRRRITNK